MKYLSVEVVICHTTTNFKFDQSVFAIHDGPPYFWDTTETRTVTHAGDIWWTLDSANAFVSPGVNSRGELVPSHDASRRRLGDKYNLVFSSFFYNVCIFRTALWKSPMWKVTVFKDH
jgi:hypothetical protein